MPLRSSQRASARAQWAARWMITLEVYDRPSFSGKLRQAYWRDLIFKIDEVVLGDEKPRHNRVWYHVNGEGYAHSGKIQPVDLHLNPLVPRDALPTGGWRR